MHCEEDRLSETFLIVRGENFTVLPLKLLMAGLVKWVRLKLMENFVVHEAIAMEMKMNMDRRGGMLDI